MRTKIFNLTLLAAMLMPVIAFSQKMDIKGIKSIEVNLACQLVLVQGSDANLEIVGDKDAVDDVETKIKNGKLIISSDRWRQHKEDVIVKIEVTDLEYLGIGGEVDMKTAKPVKFDNFTMSVSGVGNIEMALESKRFELEGSGVTTINITGKTDDLECSISGVGNVKATDFIAQRAKVSNSGVGKLYIYASENLDADVSGVGTISYSGNPLISADVSGLGKICRN